MQNSMLLTLAFNGVDHSTLVSNILAMQPAPWLAERMLGGVRTPSLEAVKAYMENRRSNLVEIISFGMGSAFVRDNVNIKWSYKDSTWCSIPADHLLTEKEWDTFRRQDDVHTSYSKSDTCCHKVEYIRTTDSSAELEDILSFEPEEFTR